MASPCRVALYSGKAGAAGSATIAAIGVCSPALRITGPSMAFSFKSVTCAMAPPRLVNWISTSEFRSVSRASAKLLAVAGAGEAEVPGEAATDAAGAGLPEESDAADDPPGTGE